MTRKNKVEYNKEPIEEPNKGEFGFFDNGRWQKDEYNDKPFCFREPEKAKEIHKIVPKLGYSGK